MARLGAAATSPVERFFQFSVLGFVTSGFLAVAGSGFLDLPTTLLMTAALVIRAFYSAGVLLPDSAPSCYLRHHRLRRSLCDGRCLDLALLRARHRPPGF